MIQMKKILLPTDFSKSSAVALNYACELASRFQAELHLLHVLEIRAVATPDFGMGLDLPGFARESRAAAERHLNAIPDPQWAEGKSIVRTVLEGTAFVEIVRYARAQAIDLIVISTHGRTGLAHVLLGSVAERIVRKAPCPVLTVRPEGQQFVMP